MYERSVDEQYGHISSTFLAPLSPLTLNLVPRMSPAVPIAPLAVILLPWSVVGNSSLDFGNHIETLDVYSLYHHSPLFVPFLS